MSFHDVIIVGAGQAGLSVAYFLRRTNLSVLLLDAEEAGGGAWQHGWDSLRLFSPASWSSIAGWPMPASGDQYPSRDHVVDYLRKYETRYEFRIERPVRVTEIQPTEQGFQVNAGARSWHSRAVVCATGTWRKSERAASCSGVGSSSWSSDHSPVFNVSVTSFSAEICA